MRAVIYARYSSEKQKDMSIDGQLRVCMDFCREKGLDIVGTYVDRAKSGKYETRDRFLEMVEDAQKKLFDVCVVYKLNRFFRNRDEAALYRRELRKGGAKLLAARDPIPEGRGGIYYEALLDAEAEAYSVGLSEDTSRGMLDAAMACQVTGRLPLGYDSVPISNDPRDGRKIEINPVETEIVKRAFEMYADGYSIPDICATFNNEGLTTKSGRKFRTTSIATMFRNVKYMGIYKYQDTVTVENGCPAIVSSELFTAVHDRIRKITKASARGKATVEFFLSGKLYCGKCKKHMFGDSGHGRKETHYYYSCSTRRRDKTCDKLSEKKEIIESAVFDGALQALTDENIAIIAAETEEFARKESENAQVIRRLQTDLKEAEDEIANISKAIAMGIITETTKEMLMTADEKRRHTKARIIHEEAIAARVMTADDVAAWLYKFRTGDKENIDFKRSVFDILVQRVDVYDEEPDGGNGYAIVWCDVAKDAKIRVDLADSDMVQLGEPHLNPHRYGIAGFV